MPEQRKRETAYKLRIGEILQGSPIVEDVAQEQSEGESVSGPVTKERFRFLELGDKKIIRVNIIANIVDKYVSEGERRFATITVDDGTGQVRLKLFGEDVAKFDELSHGDTIMIIGVLRSYNREVYVSPEIIKKTDPRYLLVRKLELEQKDKTHLHAQASLNPERKLGVREEIIEIIKSGENSGGVDTEEIILKVKSADPATINSEIIKLIEDGLVYEPRPGKVRWLG